MKKRVHNGESLESILPEAFALVREAAKRVLEMRHYDCQLVLVSICSITMLQLM